MKLGGHLGGMLSSASGRIVRTVAESTEPSMEPIPPRTTMTRISTDFMKPNLAGAMTPMHPA